MRILKVAGLFIIIACSLVFPHNIYAASDKTRDVIFLDAVKAYEQGDYASSAKGFEKIAKEHKISSPGLYYNIGNSYLKLDNHGLALLWYKRAEKLSLNDPDLKFNIGYLENKLKDDFEINKSIFSDYIFFLPRLMSESHIIKSGLIFNLLFWITFALFYFKRKQFFKPLMAFNGVVAFILLSNSFYCLLERISDREAVIIPSEVSVKSGTSDNAPDLFKLHSGTMVLIEDYQDGHVRISNGDDKRGWIRSDDAIKVFSL